MVEAFCFKKVVRLCSSFVRYLIMQMQIFLYRPYKESISNEMYNNNDLNLHSQTKLLGWLCYWIFRELQVIDDSKRSQILYSR